MNRRTPGRLALDVALAAAAVALALGLHLLYWDRGVVLLDEGYVATIASTLARGGRLYRDAVTYVLPGSFTLLAWVFQLFGESLEVARTLTLALVAGLVVLAYRVARAAMAPPEAALGAAFVALVTVWSFPQWQVYGYQQPGIVATFAATALLAPAAAGSSRARALAAGLLVGLAICCKQTHVAAAFVLGCFLVLDATLGSAPPPRSHAAARDDAALSRAPRPRSLRPRLRFGTAVVFAMAAAAPVLATILGFVVLGTFGDFWIQGVVSPLFGASYEGYVGLPPLFPLTSQDPELRRDLVHYLPSLLLERRDPPFLQNRLYRETVLVDLVLKALFYLPLLIPAAVLARLAGLAWSARRGSERAWPAVRGGALLLALAVALLAGTNRPLDWMHMCLPWLGTALLGTWLALPARELRSRSGPGRWRPGWLVATIRIGLALTLAGSLVLTVAALRDLRRNHSEPLGLEGAQIYVHPADARTLRALVRDVRGATQAGEPILVLPYQPLVYFLAGRPISSRFLFAWPVEYQRGRDREILADLDRLEVRSVVHGTTGAPQLGTLAANGPDLLAGLAERYRVAGVYGEEPFGIGFQRLERRPPFPPDTILLDTEIPGVERVLWPFERVLMATPGTDATSEVRLRIPAGATGDLVLGFGANPDRWVAERADRLDFQAMLDRDGEDARLLAERLDPQRDVRDRAWRERRFALDGREATLVLRVRSDAPDGLAPGLAGWTVPRIEPAAKQLDPARPASETAGSQPTTWHLPSATTPR